MLDARPIRELSFRRTDASVAGGELLFENRLFVVRHSAGDSTHGDSSCCLRAAPSRPRRARRHARASAPAPRGARVGGSRRRSRARSRCGVLFFCRRSWSLSRAFSLVVASCGTGPRQRALRRATRARCAWRACVASGSRRRSRAGTSRVWCSSPLFSRSVAPCAALPRSTRTPAWARASRVGARRTRHATRRARCVGSPSAERPRSSRSVFRAPVGRLVVALLSRCVVLRAPLPRSAARRGRAYHPRTRGARSSRRDARGAWGVRAPRALGARGPCSQETAVLGFPLLRTRSCSLRFAL